MIRRRTRGFSGPEWVPMVIFGVLFTGGGLAVTVAALVAAGPDDRLPLALVGLGFAVVGVVPLLLAPRSLRQSRRARGLVPATPGTPAAPGPSGTPLAKPWPVDAVASALAEALEGLAYRVEHNADTVEVVADLLDREWQVLATRRGLRRAFSTRLSVRRPGTFERTDTLRQVEWEAGVPRLAATLSVRSGRVWEYRRRVEAGVGPGGVTRAVDDAFSTSELNRRLREVVDRAGWRVALGPSARGALVVAGIGGSAVVLVPLVFLLQWLADR